MHLVARSLALQKRRWTSLDRCCKLAASKVTTQERVAIAVASSSSLAEVQLGFSSDRMQVKLALAAALGRQDVQSSVRCAKPKPN